MNKYKAKTGLVRKLTRGGPPKLFLMKTKKGDHPKGSQGGMVGNCRFRRNQAGVTTSDLQEGEATGAWTRGNHSEVPNVSAWSMAPGIDDSVFEESVASGYPGEEDKGKGCHSSLSMLRVRGQEGPLTQAPVKHGIKLGKGARVRSKRWTKGVRGSGTAWRSLICVKKTRQEEEEEGSPNGQRVAQTLIKAEREGRSCLPAQVAEYQGDIPGPPWHSTAGCDSNLSSPRGPGLSAQAQEDPSEPKAGLQEGEPESGSRSKLRRRSSGWASFRYLMKSRKDWRSFAERNTDLSGSQNQSETGILPDSRESELTASSDSKASLRKQIGEEGDRSPSENSEAAAYCSSPPHADNETLHSQTVAVSLNKHQDPSVPDASKGSQAEIHWDRVEERVMFKGSPPATSQDEVELSNDNGQETLVDSRQDGSQWSCDFEFVPLIPQGMQCEIGSAKVNPSYPLGTDGFPGHLQEKLTLAALGPVIETERQELARGMRSDSRLAPIERADLQRPSTILLQSIPLTKEETSPEPLTIEKAAQNPIQESAELQWCNLTELSIRKTTNPGCFSPNGNTKQVQDAQVGATGTSLGFIEPGMNIVRATAVPDCDSVRSPSCSEEDVTAGCQSHHHVNWDDLSEEGCWAADGRGDTDPLSDVVPGAGSQEAALLHTASCIVQSAMQAAVEQVAGETAMTILPENCPLSELLDS
ncbi:uncharacterized protein [Chiloscyllium punctatum]